MQPTLILQTKNRLNAHRLKIAIAECLSDKAAEGLNKLDVTISDKGIASLKVQGTDMNMKDMTQI